MTCSAEDCGFQMLNDVEIVTFMQKESDPVDDETDEGEDNYDNESSKGPSNANTFSVLETAMKWYEQQRAVLLNYCFSRESETLQRNVYNGTEKNKLLFSTIKVKLRHFAPIFGFLQARYPHVMIFNIRIVPGFMYSMDRIRFPVTRIIAYPNGVQPN
ncbi:uncharacterized protein TNCV_4471541 [Trichonephila clavipes]|uniref:Uncharacterized protein n=1 Tax=Trichonephila clavipes TaxID=2585209 RepID=A0A8X6VKL1_TRICX|nr:uncharacterized protein TNCV_4471541 [Trichonephila clavipes]